MGRGVDQLLGVDVLAAAADILGADLFAAHVGAVLQPEEGAKIAVAVVERQRFAAGVAVGGGVAVVVGADAILKDGAVARARVGELAQFVGARPTRYGRQQAKRPADFAALEFIVYVAVVGVFPLDADLVGGDALGAAADVGGRGGRIRRGGHCHR